MSLLKKVLLGIVIITTNLSVKSQIEPLTKMDEPKGNIKSLTESVFYIRKVKNTNQAVIGSKSTRTFDTKGKKVSEIIYGVNGSEIEKITYLYDKDGNKAGIKSLRGSVNGVSKLIQNNGGIKVIKTTFESGSTIINKYNNKGQKIEDLTYKDPKVITTKITYVYNKNGIQTARNTYSGKDLKLSNVFLFYYDNSNKLIRVDIENGSRAVLAKKMFKYDKNGFKQELSDFNPKSKANEVRTYRYTNYDKMKNWLKQATFKNGKIIEIRERKIQYY